MTYIENNLSQGINQMQCLYYIKLYHLLLSLPILTAILFLMKFQLSSVNWFCETKFQECTIIHLLILEINTFQYFL